MEWGIDQQLNMLRLFVDLQVAKLALYIVDLSNAVFIIIYFRQYVMCVVVHQCDRYFRFVNFKGDGKNKKEKIQKKDKTGYGDGIFKQPDENECKKI